MEIIDYILLFDKGLALNLFNIIKYFRNSRWEFSHICLNDLWYQTICAGKIQSGILFYSLKMWFFLCDSHTEHLLTYTSRTPVWNTGASGLMLGSYIFVYCSIYIVLATFSISEKGKKGRKNLDIESSVDINNLAGYVLTIF